MIDAAHIDIETFSEANLKQGGHYVYARHPSTEVMVLCYRFNEGPVNVWVPVEHLPKAARPIKSRLQGGELYVQTHIPDDLLMWIIEGRQLRAWNAAFERVVLDGPAGEKIGFPKVPMEQWVCVMAKARAAALPAALGNAAHATGTHPKDEAGKHVMLQLAKPRKPSKQNKDTRWALEKYPEKYRDLYHYCIDDVFAESDIDNYVPELRKAELRTYLLDQRINDRGIRVDRARVEDAISLHEDLKKVLADKCQEVTGVRPSQTAKMAEWVREEGYNIENLQVPTIAEALKDSTCPDNVKKALRIYSTHNMKAPTKYKAMLRALGGDDALRGMFIYHGAATGRWSSVIVQLQNLFRSVIGDKKDPGGNENLAIEMMEFRDLDYFRGMWKQNPMKVLASCIRGMLTAREGHKLMCIDFAAIEARVVAWLAGQLDILEVFETDGRIYEYTAMKIFGLDKVEDVAPDQRFVGKIAVLALGYQGGRKAFAKMAKNYGVEIDEEFAEQIKIDWRKSNPKIVRLWYELEETAAAAVSNPGSTYAAASGRIKFKVQGDWLYMRLPSGRCLAYYQPRLDSEGKVTFLGVDTYTRQWGRCKTYGGKLTENAVQAIARDLLVHALFTLDDADYTLLGTVHDEAIMEVPEDADEIYLKNAEGLMCELPDWAEGLPVEAEGFIAKRYRK